MCHSFSLSFEAPSACCLSTNDCAKSTEVETRSRVGENPSQVTQEGQRQHRSPGLAPEPVFLDPVMVLGAMEKVLYRVLPEEPSRGCPMEQVRPVQGLNLPWECRACAQPMASGPLLPHLLQIWPQQRALHRLLVSPQPAEEQSRPRAGPEPPAPGSSEEGEVQAGEKTVQGGNREPQRESQRGCD